IGGFFPETFGIPLPGDARAYEVTPGILIGGSQPSKEMRASVEARLKLENSDPSVPRVAIRSVFNLQNENLGEDDWAHDMCDRYGLAYDHVSVLDATEPSDRQVLRFI